MPTSATRNMKLKRRSPAARTSGLLAAAAPLLFGSAAVCQLPAPPQPPATTLRTLPSAQPTQNAPNQNQFANSSRQVAPVVAHTYRARVEFVNDRLTVAAENSSLDEILLDIAHLTGMKITGGVKDERVYGSYGPDSARAVLDELLAGTGTNVLLLETPRHNLAELVLSPRNGGPTPPSPNAMRDENRDEENLPPGLAGRRRDFPTPGRRGHIEGDNNHELRFPEQPGNGSQIPGPPGNSETPQQPDATQPSPNGVKTPQQIYEDIVRQQQQQAPAPQPQ